MNEKNEWKERKKGKENDKRDGEEHTGQFYFKIAHVKFFNQN